MSDHIFNRAGEPISLNEFKTLLGDHDYKVVKQEKISDYFVSTVWMGVNMGYGGSLLIFETMVFDRSMKENKYSDLTCERYATEAQAFEGHERIANETRLLVKLLKESNGE